MSKTETDARQTTRYPVHTSQEIDALGRATANGKSFTGYTVDEQGGKVAYAHAAIPHCVELSLTDVERRAGATVAHLEAMVRAQDADALLAQLYILGVLAPPKSGQGQSSGTGWIDFDDVIEKIGWYPQTTIQRREMHARIYEIIRFGERAVVFGERSTHYKNPHTKKKIETQIRTSLWRVASVEEPVQGTLDFGDQTPVRVEIQITPAILELVTSPFTAQFLPMGEVIGAIPGGKPSGAWARVIGLALASFWRRFPEKSLSGYYKPSRRDLLTHYPPKVAPPSEILASQNNGRAITYWCDALRLLCDSGILADEGEVLRTAKEIRQSLPPRSWQEAFLNERLALAPGAKIRAQLEKRGIGTGNFNKKL